MPREPADAQWAIALLDTHALTLEAFARLLESFERVTRVDRMHLPSEALRAALATDYSCLLLHARRSTSAETLHILRTARRLRPDIPVVVLCGSPSPQLAHGAHEAGAAATVSTGAAPEQLEEALRHAIMLPREPEVDGSARGSGARRGPDPEAALSLRARQAIALLAQGLCVERIREELGCSRSTAKRTLAEAYRALGARTRAEAERLARRRPSVDASGP